MSKASARIGRHTLLGLLSCALAAPAAPAQTDPTLDARPGRTARLLGDPLPAQHDALTTRGREAAVLFSMR